VFELLNAKSFAKILSTDPEKLEWCVQEYAKMLKLIHSTLVPAGKLPDMRQTAISWAKFLSDYLPEEAGKKLVSLVEAVPKDDHMIHGDYHTKNLELQEGEVLLIDMDTLAVGHPIFELGSMFNAFIGFYEMNSEAIKSFQGFDFETSKAFWHRSLAAYLGTNNEEVIRDVENKARIIGYTRLIRRSIRRGGLESEEKKAEIEHWTKELLELLETTDTLLFDNTTEEKAPANEVEVEAIEENLNEVMRFIDGKLEVVGCPMKVQMQIDVAVEEIFVNVAKYAYYPSVGRVKVGVDISDDLSSVVITFTDKGKPYDPLAKKDPDVTLSAEERPIGGLGIFMVKKSMDSVDYEYKDGCNILRLTKKM
jgi:anti-sigma regulatory factor (Ser/Thr protein kinase)